MSRTAVVRSYAETLLEIASRRGSEGEFGDWLGTVAALYRNEPDFRHFLGTPRVRVEEKKAALREVLGEEAPELFVRFLLVVVEKGRHRFLPEIRELYRTMLDEREGRVHVTVTLAEPPDEGLEEDIATKLSEVLEGEVDPHYRTDPEILGGVVIRVDDRVMDGSLSRQLRNLKRSLLESEDMPVGS